MRRHLKKWFGLLAVASLIAGGMAGAASTASALELSPRIIPPQAKIHGMTYGEWSARWWQWALSLPADQNPFSDADGSCTNGANGQLGPVWFLTGGINPIGEVEPVRDCTVPVGKALLLPLINIECSTIEADPWYGGNEEELPHASRNQNSGLRTCFLPSTG